jgi:hypothetical protein
MAVDKEDDTTVHSRTKQLFVSIALAGSLFATASSAFANDCEVANKPVGAGSVGTINIDTGALTPSKSNPGTESNPHGGFVTLTGTAPNGATISADTFVHAPTKAQAPFAEPGVNPGASNQESKGKGCDHKGLDTIDSCLGG